MGLTRTPVRNDSRAADVAGTEGKLITPKSKKPNTSHLKLRLGLTAVSLAVAGSALAAGSSQASVDRFLAQSLAHPNQGASESLILRLREPLAASQLQKLNRLGADVYRHLDVIQSVAVSVPKRNLRRVLSLPFIERASADVKVTKNDEFTVGRSGADIAFNQFGLSGSGVTVAVLDSGIGSNSDLNDPKNNSSRVLAATSFVANDTSTDDKYGHGTHVAGIIAGNGAASSTPDSFRTFFGIARQSNRR